MISSSPPTTTTHTTPTSNSGLHTANLRHVHLLRLLGDAHELIVHKDSRGVFPTRHDAVGSWMGRGGSEVRRKGRCEISLCRAQPSLARNPSRLLARGETMNRPWHTTDMSENSRSCWSHIAKEELTRPPWPPEKKRPC